MTDAGWHELVERRDAPMIVYIWASWSRESVELLPTILELDQEYEGRGVEFVYVSLDVDDPAAAQALMRQLNGPAFYRVAVPLEEAFATLGISEPPALISYGDGEAQTTMEGGSLAPDDAEALVESLVANQL